MVNWKERTQALREKLNKHIDVDNVLSRARDCVHVASEAAEVLASIHSPMTATGAIGLFARVTDRAIQMRTVHPSEYFKDEWSLLPIGGLEGMCSRALLQAQDVTCKRIHRIDDAYQAYETTISGMEIAFVIADGENSFWRRNNVDPEDILAAIGIRVWRLIGATDLKLSASEEERSSFVLEMVPLGEQGLPSQAATEAVDRLRSFLEAGMNRSVLLWGRPGTGKSSMLKYIASNLGTLRLRVPVHQLENIGASALLRIVSLLRPDVLVIDDFDRLFQLDEDNDPATRNMLEPLEELNKIVPLLLVSMNQIGGISDAVLRPGRFDEIFLLRELDEEVYRSVLKGAPSDMIRRVMKLDLPVAYLAEVAKRAEVLGWTEAEKELRSMMERSRDLRWAAMDEERQAKRKSRIWRSRSHRDMTPSQLANLAQARAKRSERLQQQAEKLRQRAEEAAVKAAERKRKQAERAKKAKEAARAKKAKEAARAKKAKEAERAKKAKPEPAKKQPKPTTKRPSSSPK
jgi:hypothetical protein